GFLASVRGRNGGVRLARPAAKIRIGDVVRAIESRGFDGAASDDPNEDLGRIVDSALEAFITVLDQHTLAEMAQAGQVEASARSPGGRSGKAKAATQPAGRTRRTQQWRGADVTGA